MYEDQKVEVRIRPLLFPFFRKNKIKSAPLPVNIYDHKTLKTSNFNGAARARQHQDEALQERYQHHCTASLHREYARACVCVCARCDVLQWWGAGIACRCTAHFLRAFLCVRACINESDKRHPSICSSLHSLIHPVIHSLTHCVTKHSPIWTLLGNAPIASPQKLENMSRNQSWEEILILFRL